jgi:serine protease SohB
MHFLAQYGLFTLETFTLVIAILLLAAGLLSINRKPKDNLQIVALDKAHLALEQHVYKEIFGKKNKALTQQYKNKKHAPSCFVLEFKGDVLASQVQALRQEISAILSVATPQDLVILRLESPGGSVNGYGLAAAQLHRLRERQIPLIACIDQVAASGGYLMACVANQIIASPFAIIGSIGVVAQLPNFHRWLKKQDIDVELLTAGEYKRTLTLFGENTSAGRKKFQEDLENIHAAFRQYVLSNRQKLDMDQVSTGEHWLAIDALALGLVDELKTSDEVIDAHRQNYKLYAITLDVKESLRTKLLKPLMQMMQNYWH